MAMDSLDLRIIDLLAQDGRIPFAQIAGQVGVSTATVHQRVKRLRAANVIKGFKLELDWKAVGLPVSAIISIVARSAQPLVEIADDLRKIPYVTSCASVTGEFDLVATVRAATPDHLGQIIDEIRVISDGSTVTALVLTAFFDDTAPALAVEPPA
jgi:DNA-binding Lrp family transcriptional regulator